MSAPFQAISMPELQYGCPDLATASQMNGIDQLRAIVKQELPAPPIVEMMRQWIHEIAEGRILFLGNPSEHFLNPIGLVHGGWSMTLLDSALGCAVQTTLQTGETFVSLSTEVKFLRPVLPDMHQVRCEGVVDYRGKTIATASGKIEDLEGRLLATGTTTCAIRRRG